ncbi:MAG: hypothetical protein KKA05_02155 [Alphaproteobacteria bacterium]|nr:hypothetical protein [Alphaproteobacteria bacterium]MBU0859469.1 hypothetical protein [Alphaproteobacteria bacterium]
MNEPYDFLPHVTTLSKERAKSIEKVEAIVEALNYLKNSAHGENEDIYNLLNSTFNIALVFYNTLLREEFTGPAIDRGRGKKNTG